MEQKILTREEFKQEQQIDKQDVKPKRIRIRLIPIWLRIILVILAVCFAAIFGSIVGYSIMGDGKPSEIFELETWSHIKELVEKDV